MLIHPAETARNAHQALRHQLVLQAKKGFSGCQGLFKAFFGLAVLASFFKDRSKLDQDIGV